MSRKSIIISLTVLAVMFIGIGVAVLYLYSGMDMPSRPEKSHVADNDRHMLLSAVPSGEWFRRMVFFVSLFVEESFSEHGSYAYMHLLMPSSTTMTGLQTPYSIPSHCKRRDEKRHQEDVLSLKRMFNLICWLRRR